MEAILGVAAAFSEDLSPQHPPAPEVSQGSPTVLPLPLLLHKSRLSSELSACSHILCITASPVILVMSKQRPTEKKGPPTWPPLRPRHNWSLKLVLFLKKKKLYADHSFKFFTESVTILLRFYVLVFWQRGMWDLSSLDRD